ncbi:MAG: DNA polymerase III subunit alpha [Fimbriimonadales bacterium]|nr:DNA polymerase III subunit alpha [Fimbriimonadales bacterium]
MNKPFVHLHNHTEYSLLDGAQRIPQMVSRAKEMGMPALAITDHGAMYGVMEFYGECKKQGIKPIIGMEAYVAPQGRKVRSGRKDGNSYHLLLLAKNRTGYLNLCKLATIASLEGFYHYPRIDHEVLREHAEGLICTTTCLGSEVNQYLLAGDFQRALDTAAMYKDIFGEQSYFVELQDHRLKEQAAIRGGLLEISAKLNLPLLATNDSHYLCKTDHQAHDVLLCIQTNAKVSERDRMRFETEEFYLKSCEEMEDLFHATPEAIENTLMVAEMCDVDLGEDRAELPDPIIPDGIAPDEYLSKLSLEALPQLISDNLPEAEERLNYELEVIKQTGFAKYFLLVREFAQFSRSNGIYFGVRGSAAGSLVSYCIGITDVDPLYYGLTFERFLNPERIQMPDIDMDFEDARRDEVIEYVKKRFGEDHVAQIITFGTLGAKAAIRDAGRALGLPAGDVDRLAKMVPSLPVGITLDQALETSSELREAHKSDSTAQNLIETAKRIEGIARHAGVHAAGIVISKEPLSERVPLAKGSDDQIITQFPMGDLEKIGLLKMDFLGLSNLTVLANATKNISENKKGELDIRAIPLDDKKTYEMLGKGETAGVFQLESEGMRRAITQLKPDSIQDITALVALYRPGPMEHISTYASAKHGRIKPTYLHPLMEPILKETHGVIVYQDQVLMLVRALAGFSLGKADILRRAMGKKDKKLLDSMKVEFVEGAAKNGIDEPTCEKVWTLLEPFAGYAFNKAHAVCYALIAYQTAYLKANYPVEYMAALLGAYRGKEDRVVGLVEECRRMGIEVLAPDINRSSVDFTIEDGKIRFGLGAIKGIGDSTIQSILKARTEKAGFFTHIFDVAVCVKAHGGLNRTGLEALIKAGALDSIDANRQKLLSVVDTALAFADKVAREREAGQAALFSDGDGESNATGAFPILPEVPRPTKQETLSMEKEVLGLYVSDHPLRGHERSVMAAATHTASIVQELADGERVAIAGVIARVQNKAVGDNKEPMAILTLEDLTGQVDVAVYGKSYQSHKHLLAKDKLIVVRGKIKQRELRTGQRMVGVVAFEVEQLDEAANPNPTGQDDSTLQGVISVKILKATPDELLAVMKLMKENPGEFAITLEVAQMNGNGHPKTLKTYHLLNRVSDGAWVQQLRRSLSQSFIIVQRKPGTFTESSDQAVG